MTDFCKYVDVFQGCAKIDLPRPEGVAAAWNFIKGLTGNTCPAATLPFGKMSCGCFSGGYPTGYGSQELNAGEPVKKFTDKLMTLGIAHLHQHGTGAIGTYYNYALTTPFFGGLENIRIPKTIADENARPGYYSLATEEDNISFEVTVSEKCAVHGYHFGKDGGRIAVDFANNGLYQHPDLRGKTENGKITIIGKNEVAAEVELQGLKMYFHVICEDSSSISLYRDHEFIAGKTYSFEVSDGQTGCVLEIDSQDACVKVAISTRNAEMAEKLAHDETRSLSEIADAAYKTWNKYLLAIEISADERTKRIFYSNLYHSLTKPSDWSGESHIFDENDFVVDFSTLWDIYKTQMPLVFSLYSEMASKTINAYTNVCDKLGIFPNTLLVNADYGIESNQARALGYYLICDAYYRGTQNVDWDRALDCAVRDMKRPSYSEFREKGYCRRATHILDMSQGAANIGAVANELGRKDVSDFFSQFADYWENAFDRETGLLTTESEYYEGNLWNYSFRLMIDMEARISLCGSRERFIEYLDKFFGFTDVEDVSARFEGFNNETDMEAPYAYVYAGRQDRLCDVINGANKYMFVDGRGGIPGNNDSGGLSACYIWNTIGIFPVSGQNLMLIGCPQLPKAVMHLASGCDFTVVRLGEGDYVDYAVLNGRKLDDFSFTVHEMMEGGVLEVTMKKTAN